MEVNFTLFVQMGNFAIAYCLLRYLFFKPALVLLDVQEQHLLTTKNKLQEHEYSLDKQRQQVEHAWHQCRDYFKEKTPGLISAQSSFFRNIVPTFQPEKLNTEECAKKQEELERVIIKKVSHVRP